MSDFRPQPERRRLTMSHCDAVTAAGGRSTSTTADEVMTELKTLGLHDIVVRHCAPAGRCVLLKSCTDDDLKSRGSFKKKDERIVAGVKTADDRVIASVGKDDEMKKFVQQQNIGWNCRKGLKAESPNQDTFSVIVVEGVFALYCVYDGHGPNGHDVSDLVADKLMALFLKSKDRLTDPGAAFTSAFLQCQEQVAKTVTPNPAMSGTTCTMAYHDYKTGKITIAHVGDSRAVLGKRRKSDQKIEVEELTIDHKPNLPDERRRIESSNPPGRVVFDGFYNHRVFSQKGMYPGLNMSRAIGDVVGHEEAGLTAQPDIKEINLEEMKKDFSAIVLILCTDGVWEFIDSQCAVDMVYSYNSKSKCDEAIEHLAKESYDCWMKDSDNEISDDITGLLVHLI